MSGTIYSDKSHSDDLVRTAGSTDITESMNPHGLLSIERFSPPSREEVLGMVIKMSQDDIVERLERLNVPCDSTKPMVRVMKLVERLQWAPEYRSELLQVNNLITQVGDQYYGERAAGIGSPPGQVTCMKLGTGSTAVAKTGAGAALVTYLSGSDKAIDGGYPTSALSGSSRRIQWKTSWGAGVINGSALREAVIVVDTLADATSTAANTISRALFGPMTLGASDTLSISWNHDILGA